MSETKEPIPTPTPTMCEVCGKHKATHKDFRFMDGYFNGKVLSCKWCAGLADYALVDIVRDNLDPKEFYDEL